MRYFVIEGNMINVGCMFEDSLAMVYNNLILSRMLRDLPDFMSEVLKFLQN